jgi:predicted RNase H-like HicB family nuclease
MAKQRKRDRFDGYAVELFPDEDNDGLAHLVELPGISAFGPTPEKALEELDAAWAAAKESYAAHGLEIPVAPARLTDPEKESQLCVATDDPCLKEK